MTISFVLRPVLFQINVYFFDIVIFLFWLAVLMRCLHKITTVIIYELLQTNLRFKESECGGKLTLTWIWHSFKTQYHICWYHIQMLSFCLRSQTHDQFWYQTSSSHLCSWIRCLQIPRESFCHCLWQETYELEWYLL